MKKLLNYSLLMLGLLSFSALETVAQNTIITDDDGQNAHSSAMLDVYSTSKGFLAPRMTTDQRNAISTPAEGLLVYDTDEDAFFMYASTGWTLLDQPAIWQENFDTVYVTGSGKRYGVGTASPLAKLTVQGDASIASDEPLFEVKNSEGDVIFAVYENEVKVNFKEGTKGVKGGFAIGGLTGTKSTPTEYMRITPDSVRIYIKDPAKGVKGGFAIGGLTGTKAASDKYLTIERDSTRIYVDNATKGVKGGFAIGGLTGTKSGGSSFLNLTSENYLIGEGAGSSITTGQYNSFMGYQAGFNNSEGKQNIFIGYQAGHANEFGKWNTFLGFEAGFSNNGSDNTFIGYKAGRAHTSHGGNVHIGSKAGEFATNGEQNIFIGESAGSVNATGSHNVFMGFQSGFSNSIGVNNVFLGYMAGHQNVNGNTNVFIGKLAGENNVDGFGSVLIGEEAGRSNNGDRNVFIGRNAGHTNTTGTDNVYLGSFSGQQITTGSQNTFVGVEAGDFAEGGSGNIYVGNRAGYDNNGDQNVVIGQNAGSNDNSYSNPSTTYEKNVFIGHRSAFKQQTGHSNVFVGFYTGYNNETGTNNVFIGNQAGQNETGSNKLIINSSLLTDPLIYGEFDNRNVVINGQDNNTFTFYVNGTAGGTSGWSTKSDLNAKTDVKSITGALEKVKKLNGVSFKWIDKKEMGTQFGLNGQEVKEIIPEIVGDEESGFAIEYGTLTPLLIEAVKEQQKQIEALIKANQELRTIIDNLK